MGAWHPQTFSKIEVQKDTETLVIVSGESKIGLASHILLISRPLKSTKYGMHVPTARYYISGQTVKVGSAHEGRA